MKRSISFILFIIAALPAFGSGIPFDSKSMIRFSNLDHFIRGKTQLKVLLHREGGKLVEAKATYLGKLDANGRRVIFCHVSQPMGKGDSGAPLYSLDGRLIGGDMSNADDNNHTIQQFLSIEDMLRSTKRFPMNNSEKMAFPHLKPGRTIAVSEVVGDGFGQATISVITYRYRNWVLAQCHPVNGDQGTGTCQLPVYLADMVGFAGKKEASIGSCGIGTAVWDGRAGWIIKLGKLPPVSTASVTIDLDDSCPRTFTHHIATSGYSKPLLECLIGPVRTFTDHHLTGKASGTLDIYGHQIPINVASHIDLVSKLGKTLERQLQSKRTTNQDVYLTIHITEGDISWWERWKEDTLPRLRLDDLFARPSIFLAILGISILAMLIGIKGMWRSPKEEVRFRHYHVVFLTGLALLCFTILWTLWFPVS